MGKLIKDWEFIKQIRKAKAVDKIDGVRFRLSGFKILDLGFLSHTVEGFTVSNLHEYFYLKKYTNIFGVDIKYEPMKSLKVDHLYNTKTNFVVADVTDQLPFKDNSFTSIVAADLIEHLDDFDAFLENCHRLLKDRSSGRLIITTPNPFYIDLWLYSWLRSDIQTNPEHTCWICPVTLKQVLERYGFEIKEFFWLKNNWNLFAFITQRKSFYYDTHLAQWNRKNYPEKLALFLLRYIWFVVRKILTSFSPLNRYANYMVVCEKK